MAQRRRKQSKFRRLSGEYVDDLAVLSAGYGAFQLPYHYTDFVGDTKRSYLKKVSSLSKRRVRIDAPEQLSFSGFSQPKTKPIIGKREATRLRNQIHKAFSRKPKRSSFRFFREMGINARALKGSYLKGAPRELIKMNRKALLGNALRRGLKALPSIGLTFLAVPLAKAWQAKYAPKRKFKKEVKRGIRRGIVNPIYGGVVGVPLSETLHKYPYLRRAKSVRSLEGKLTQKYGQGVGFYRGSSGFTKEELNKLNRSLKEQQLQRRR